MLSSLVPLGLTVPVLLASDPFPSEPERAADLVDLVPVHTTSVWSWRSGADTELLEERILGVTDAIVEARFDQFAFDAMDLFGAPPDLVQELRAVRNVVTSLGGVVPWRELVREEVVYAETNLSTLLPCTDMPGMLLGCRPAPGQAEDIEGSLAGLMGAVAGTLGFLRYDIREEPRGVQRYELVLRGQPRDRALVQVAVHDGVFLLGMGEEYFDEAVELLAGRGGARLSETPRFVQAFGDLPRRAAGRSYVDVSLLVDDLEGLNARLAGREFNTGLWQGVINGALDLAGTVETVASTTSCEGSRVTTRTLTRFDPATPAIVRTGMSRNASASLLDFVPQEAASFDMRGEVDLATVLRYGLERWQAHWPPAEDVLWAGNVAEAVLGLSIEDDLLSWIGDEHVSIELPATDGGSGTERVVLVRTADADRAAKCLQRAEDVFHAMAPRLLGRLQELMLDAQVPVSIDVQVTPGPRDFPTLRRLHVAAFPFLVADMLVGTQEGLFVFATSEESLRTCLATAAGERPGLAERPLAARLVGRDDLCSAGLEPMGRGVGSALRMLGMIAGFLQGAEESMDGSDPQAEMVVGLGLDLLTRVEDVLLELDFLGDAVRHGRVLDGGLARYEESTVELRMPGAAQRGEAPLADAAH